MPHLARAGPVPEAPAPLPPPAPTLREALSSPPAPDGPAQEPRSVATPAPPRVQEQTAAAQVFYGPPVQLAQFRATAHAVPAAVGCPPHTGAAARAPDPHASWCGELTPLLPVRFVVPGWQDSQRFARCLLVPMAHPSDLDVYRKDECGLSAMTTRMHAPNREDCIACRMPRHTAPSGSRRRGHDALGQALRSRRRFGLADDKHPACCCLGCWSVVKRSCLLQVAFIVRPRWTWCCRSWPRRQSWNRCCLRRVGSA